MTTVVNHENPHAGQGAVLLDIGGDVGALVVLMPDELLGEEVDIRPVDGGTHDHGAHTHTHDHDHGGHDHHHEEGHVPHVAVVARPVGDRMVASLVYPELVQGDYALSMKGSHEIELVANVVGGEVTTLDWPG